MFCGLTGTGKSTIAKAIAEAMDIKYISSSKLFREFAGKDVKKGQEFWAEKEGQNFLEERLNTDIDEQFDKHLLNVLDTKDDFVIDSWTMPWLYNNDQVLRIYLRAPFNVRVNRVMFRDKLNEPDARAAIKKKDSDTRKIYLQKYLFDINKDLENFDLVINTQYFDSKAVILYILNYVKTFEKYYK
jgi:predicted cytidylate kinase